MEKSVDPKSTTNSEIEPMSVDNRLLRNDWNMARVVDVQAGFKWTRQIGQSHHGNDNPRSTNRPIRADPGE